jgi:hypothetical protein
MSFTSIKVPVRFSASLQAGSLFDVKRGIPVAHGQTVVGLPFRGIS